MVRVACPFSASVSPRLRIPPPPPPEDHLIFVFCLYIGPSFFWCECLLFSYVFSPRTCELLKVILVP